MPKKFKKIGTLLFMYVETIVSKHNNLNKNHIKKIVQKKERVRSENVMKFRRNTGLKISLLIYLKKIEKNIEQKKTIFFCKKEPKI